MNSLDVAGEIGQKSTIDGLVASQQDVSWVQGLWDDVVGCSGGKNDIISFAHVKHCPIHQQPVLTP